MKIKDKDLTYGFEIEGVFGETLPRLLKKKKVTYTESGDGSVRQNNIVKKYGLKTKNILADGEAEIKAGVFDNLKQMETALALFENGKNYWADTSCGLHIHIKGKEGTDQFGALFWDLVFIRKLENFAYANLCQCVKDRKNNQYCQPYKTFEKFYQDYCDHEKYRFVRKHPQGTMEFRFFSPCEHKEENVKKFFAYMFAELENQKQIKTKTTSLPSIDHELVKIVNFKLNAGKEIRQDIKQTIYE